MDDETMSSTATEPPRILVGVDGSPCADRALEHAAMLAAATGSILHIVAAYTEFPGYNPFGAVLDQEGGRALVTAAIDRVRLSHPDVVTKGSTGFGMAGLVLSNASDGASELVVGTRGHGHVVGTMLGSVSEYVLHHAHCMTTVVR
jgi:nucleotide-binding universal stress UspA family protein